MAREKEMTEGDLFEFFQREAKRYRKNALGSLERSAHTHNLTKADIRTLRFHQPKLFKRLLDAILVDFINTMGADRGGDYGLYVHYLDE